MDIEIIYNNVREMLLERGDNVDEFDEHYAGIEDKYEFYSDKNVIEFHTSNTTVIFALTKKLRKSIIEELKDFVKTDIMNFSKKYNDKKNIILIFNNDTISTPVVQQLHVFDKMFQKHNGMMQYFHVKNILFNPTKHQLVPKHTKLTPEETTEVMDKYLIKGKAQMPFILHSDAISKWVGLKQGDVVKIERYNENSGLYYYYRVCV
jgi:DNA-directed RNA polymerase subunit H (RpoH/RPB5)